jgi:hypothetical protein
VPSGKRVLIGVVLSRMGIAAGRAFGVVRAATMAT